MNDALRWLPKLLARFWNVVSPMIESHAEGALLHVHVKPKASQNAILGVHSRRLKLAVTAAPERGKANAAVVDVLAARLGLKRSQVSLVSGDASPMKCFLVRELARDDLRSRVESALKEIGRSG